MSDALECLSILLTTSTLDRGSGEYKHLSETIRNALLPNEEKPITPSQLEKGKIYYIRGQDLWAEYVGIDVYCGQSSYEFFSTKGNRKLYERTLERVFLEQPTTTP